ncbi:MAG TPA: lysylphosphatidylglycerol synthase transmembrane domain-containing protein [Candidatus Binatia bacterium]|nr:lysylphosphatidylglycerol synthase transmembrane domain-containing protein [Candidatus Binatia bacterium]
MAGHRLLAYRGRMVSGSVVAVSSRAWSGPRRRPALRRLASRGLPLVAAVAGLAALVKVIDPQAVVASLGRLDPWILAPIAGLIVGASLLQGLRWHLLLRRVGARAGLVDSELTNLSAQAVSAVVPFGDLTRAVMASRATGISLGRVAATVTLQELTFSLLVVLGAAPAIARLPGGPVLMAGLVLAIAGIVALLTVPALFALVRHPLRAIPGARRLVDELDSLRDQVGRLLVDPRALAGAGLDAARVLLTNAALILVLRGFQIDSVGWWQAALVLAVSFVGGALSMLPGGIGANEASVVGVLVLLGINPAAAAAAALVFRLMLTLVPAACGAGAYAVLRRRHSLRRVQPRVSPRRAADAVPAELAA